jgi:hypothetical protein
MSQKEKGRKGVRGQLITGVRLRKDRAEALKTKSIELTIKTRDIVKETDIVNYLIDECLERVDMDDLGFVMKKDNLAQ